MQEITITTFLNRRSSRGRVESCSWGDFKKRLKNAVVTNETVDEYKSSTNEERTEIKDVGGFVGGLLSEGRRSKSTLENRCIVTIDADTAKPDDVESFEIMYDYEYFVHTTHTSTRDNPRLRWVFPLSRPVTADEYRIIARTLAQMVGSDTVDESTDQPERLMFWPSVSLDGDFQTWEGGSETINPDDFLSSVSYEPYDCVDDEPVDDDFTSDYVEVEEPEEPAIEKTADVYEGGRNKQVFGYASLLRSSGLDSDAMAYAIYDYNDRYCHPPLPAGEIDTIIRSVCGRYAQGDKVIPTLRDAWDDFNDLGVDARQEAAPAKKRLSLESAKSLCLRNIEPPKYVVSNLITTGITVLASPPKFGKSWLCTDLCQCIATGTPFLGMETTQSKVLYLALEDGEFRLKDRGLKVSGGKQLPEDMYIAMDAPLLQDGLLEELKAQIQELGGVGCIVIDTLQKIRGVAKRTEGVYGYDYRELGDLHKFALENNIALVLVHHLNKGGDDNDFVSRLNGSTGLSGAADSIITMTRAARGDRQTKMSITGRDVKERTLILQMNWSTYRWENLGEEEDVRASQEDSEYSNDPVVRLINYRLDEAEDMLEDDTEADTVTFICTSSELLNQLKGMYGDSAFTGSASSLGQHVASLTDKLKTNDGITYDYVITDSRREHKFTRYIV